MEKTLYYKLRSSESINERLKRLVDSARTSLKEFESLPGFSSVLTEIPPQIDIFSVQKELIKSYESNPVFYDAVSGKQSIEDSLNELSKVNKGIRKILPRVKNSVHNKRVNQIEELISGTLGLRTYGIFAPDNLITAGAEITAMTFGTCYLLSRYLFAPNLNLSQEEFQQMMTIQQVILPTTISAISAPVMGMTLNSPRFLSRPINEAKYLDAKVQEFYR